MIDSMSSGFNVVPIVGSNVVGGGDGSGVGAGDGAEEVGLGLGADDDG